MHLEEPLNQAPHECKIGTFVRVLLGKLDPPRHESAELYNVYSKLDQMRRLSLNQNLMRHEILIQK